MGGGVDLFLETAVGFRVRHEVVENAGQSDGGGITPGSDVGLAYGEQIVFGYLGGILLVGVEDLAHNIGRTVAGAVIGIL
jgi:hypothetical protein